MFQSGMTLPRRLSKWGRSYVGSWIEKDRAAGIRIDPRVEAYDKGRRSPYEPLRFVPSTWKIFAGEQPVPTLSKMQLFVDIRDRFNQPNVISPAEDAQPTWLQELRELAALCRSHLLLGFAVAQMALFILEIFYPMPDVFPKQPGEVTWAELATAAVGGLIWTNLVVLWRTMTR